MTTSDNRKTSSGRLKSQSAGFSLIEMVVVTALLCVLITALFVLFSVANKLFRAGNVASDLEEQGRLAITQIAADLKQTGYYYDVDSGKNYPYIFANGSADGLFSVYSHDPAAHQAEPGTLAYGPTKEVVFRLPKDIDGDGYKTSETTGKIEWGTEEISYQLRTGPDGVNRLERRVNNGAPQVVASNVERVAFDDVFSDPTVPYGQVRIIIQMRKTDTDGRVICGGYATKVKMRNYERED